MISLIIHLVLGFLTAAVIVKTNPEVFKRIASGPQISMLETFYYGCGIAGLVLGYYFNNQYVAEYAPAGGGLHNFIWGPGSWSEFIALGYDNPAASSASQDYTIMSVLIFPVWLVIDGRRRDIKHAWLFLGFILFASSASAWAFYLAAVERQRRHKLASSPAEFLA